MSVSDAATQIPGAGDPGADELVACESMVLDETNDRPDRELLGKRGEQLTGDRASVLETAVEGL